MWTVLIEKKAQKELDKAPEEIQQAFDTWFYLVQAGGPETLKKINGYWDHPLKQQWEGCRASSLNKSWRVIYRAERDTVQVYVVRISAHDYGGRK